MDETITLLVYSIDEKNLALPAHTVKQAIRMVEIMPLPFSSDSIMGLINYYGEIVPVVNMRKVLGIEGRDVRLEDCLIIARTEKRTIGLWADTVIGIEEHDASAIISPDKYLAHSDTERPSIKGCIRLDTGLLIIQDIEVLISAEDEGLLQGL